jgi:hypothetical protein
MEFLQIGFLSSVLSLKCKMQLKFKYTYELFLTAIFQNYCYSVKHEISIPFSLKTHRVSITMTNCLVLLCRSIDAYCETHKLPEFAAWAKCRDFQFIKGKYTILYGFKSQKKLNV